MSPKTKPPFFLIPILAIFIPALWLAGMLIGLQMTLEPAPVDNDPEVEIQINQIGKSSEPGVLSPETIQAIQIQSAKDVFSGKMRDPMERKRDMGQYRWQQQRCVEEQEVVE